MDKFVFSIAYSGAALEDGSMDIKDFAPALLSLGDLIDEANRTINQNETKIQVRVRADFVKGSFDVTLEIVRSILQQLSIALGTEVTLSDLLSLLGFVGGGGLSLFGLIKMVRKRKIKEAREIGNNNVSLYFTDNSETITVNKNVYNLYINQNVQEAAEGVTKPLYRDGIDGFTVYESPVKDQNKAPSLSVTKEEAAYFGNPIIETSQEPELLVSVTNRGAYSLVTVHFEEGYKWRLTNGQDKITAMLKDEEFIHEIEKNEISFSKDDILVIDYMTKQWRNPDGSLKTENEIIKVIDHRKNPKQIAIPFISVSDQEDI